MSFGVTILGSGTIIPTKERRATSILFDIEGKLFLLDCGPCVPDSMAKLYYDFSDVRYIFLSHLHPDHTLGLPHLMAALNQIKLDEDLHTISIYGPSGLRRFFQRMSLLYKSTHPKRFLLDIVELDEERFTLPGGIEVRTKRVYHGDCPALAYRIEYQGKTIAYTGDTDYDDRLIDIALQADALISECSFPDDMKREGHMTPKEVGRLAEESDVGKLIVVHMYPEIESADIKGVIGGIYDGEIYIADDFFHITI